MKAEKMWNGSEKRAGVEWGGDRRTPRRQRAGNGFRGVTVEAHPYQRLKGRRRLRDCVVANGANEEWCGGHVSELGVEWGSGVGVEWERNGSGMGVEWE